MSHQHGAHYGIVVEVVLILLEHADTLIFTVADRTSRRVDVAGKHLEKSRLTRAVRAYNTVAVAVGKLEIYLVEQLASAELQT